ncbi:MAG: type II toxin-antitoxin system VapC family toxin [Solirubrobacterales bacterium]
MDADDAHHDACRSLIQGHAGITMVPTLCLAEVAHLLASRGQWEGEVRLVGTLASGALVLEPVAPADLVRVAELVATYRDLPLGTVDASVVAAAERLGITTIATLDRRHFGVVRPAHVEAFELVP